MSDDSPAMPWMNAWLAAEQTLVAARRATGEPEAVDRLLALGGDYAGIATDYFRSIGAPAGLEVMRAGFIERYRRLFSPDAAIAGAGTNARCQAAFRRCGELAAVIAIDAFKRLSAELANPDPAAPPVTSLGELHELWIECGEAAYAAAAHSEEFAEAQAELLAALVELRFEQQN
jgi:hypothetical protein